MINYDLQVNNIIFYKIVLVWDILRLSRKIPFQWNLVELPISYLGSLVFHILMKIRIPLLQLQFAIKHNFSSDPIPLHYKRYRMAH